MSSLWEETWTLRTGTAPPGNPSGSGQLGDYGWTFAQPAGFTNGFIGQVASGALTLRASATNFEAVAHATAALSLLTPCADMDFSQSILHIDSVVAPSGGGVGEVKYAFMTILFGNEAGATVAERWFLFTGVPFDPCVLISAGGGNGPADGEITIDLGAILAAPANDCGGAPYAGGATRLKFIQFDVALQRPGYPDANSDNVSDADLVIGPIQITGPNCHSGTGDDRVRRGYATIIG